MSQNPTIFAAQRQTFLRELKATREKLRLLEARYEAKRRAHDGDQHVHELSMRSLKKLINQLREEIARFESRSSTEPDSAQERRRTKQ